MRRGNFCQGRSSKCGVACDSRKGSVKTECSDLRRTRDVFAGDDLFSEVPMRLRTPARRFVIGLTTAAAVVVGVGAWAVGDEPTTVRRPKIETEGTALAPATRPTDAARQAVQPTTRPVGAERRLGHVN